MLGPYYKKIVFLRFYGRGCVCQLSMNTCLVCSSVLRTMPLRVVFLVALNNNADIWIQGIRVLYDPWTYTVFKIQNITVKRYLIED